MGGNRFRFVRDARRRGRSFALPVLVAMAIAAIAIPVFAQAALADTGQNGQLTVTPSSGLTPGGTISDSTPYVSDTPTVQVQVDVPAGHQWAVATCPGDPNVGSTAGWPPATTFDCQFELWHGFGGAQGFGPATVPITLDPYVCGQGPEVNLNGPVTNTGGKVALGLVDWTANPAPPFPQTGPSALSDYVELTYDCSGGNGIVQGQVKQLGGGQLPAASEPSIGMKACADGSASVDCQTLARTAADASGGYSLSLAAGADGTNYDLWVFNLGNEKSLGGPFDAHVVPDGTTTVDPEVAVAIAQGVVTNNGTPFDANTAGIGSCEVPERGTNCPTLRFNYDDDGDGNVALALPAPAAPETTTRTVRGFAQINGNTVLSQETYPAQQLSSGDLIDPALVFQTFVLPSPDVQVRGRVHDPNGASFSATTGFIACTFGQDPPVFGGCGGQVLKSAQPDGSFTTDPFTAGHYSARGFTLVGQTPVGSQLIDLDLGIGDHVTCDITVVTNSPGTGPATCTTDVATSESGVAVQPTDPATNTTPVAVTFDSITGPGTTSVISSSMGPATPSGFAVGGSYYDVSTTATFEGNVSLCFDYDPAAFPSGSTLALLHYDGSQWQDVTTSVDTDAHVICGTTTSLSPFVVAALTPTISGFTPTSGGVGTSVTVTGTHLTGATAVTFNNTGANFNVDSDGQVTATVPAGATTGKIAVATPGGTAQSANNFTVNANAPTISSFSPATGGVGTSVAIKGTNLNGATAVKFNGTAASFKVKGSTQIAATVPAGATTGRITVTTPNGTGMSAGDFTVILAPTITSFSPTSGKVGTSVTITGTNFTGATAVTFQGTKAKFTVDSATQITATVPKGAKTGPIAVTSPGGTATSTTSFTVTK